MVMGFFVKILLHLNKCDSCAQHWLKIFRHIEEVDPEFKRIVERVKEYEILLEKGL